jgi:uncharacterized RDD family membrane protein YckC
VRARLADRRKARERDLPLFREPPPAEAAAGRPAAAEREAHAPPPASAPEDAAPDLPLAPPAEASQEEPAPAAPAGPTLLGAGAFPPPAAADEREWALGGEEEPSPPPRRVERPAEPLDRLAAAAVDCLLVSSLALAAFYFASRIARVTLAGLLPAWPFLGAYAAGLGMAYSVYFTGLTGQTIGKIAFGLRVLGRHGGPPSHLEALGRAALGMLGVAVAGLGVLPSLLDPARRALHDRVFKTRVVKV